MNQFEKTYYRWISFGIVIAAVFTTWFIYSQSQNLTWQFDDYANLKGLAQASDRAGLIDFVFGGVAGPSGRPISLLTFLPNYADWTENPWGMVQLNLIIHCLNGLMIFAIVIRIFEEDDYFRGKYAYCVSTMCTLFWILAPINASGILMPVQRMTEVSAFFVFMGIWLYLVLRQRYATIPSFSGTISLLMVVAIFTALAVLAKENGVVLLGLVALIEGLVFFKRWHESKYAKKWSMLIVLLASVVPFAIAVHVVKGWEGINIHFNNYRGYSFSDNIATQLTISWEYIRQMVSPRAALLGPFHDNYSIRGFGGVLPYIAIAAWFALLAFAIYGLKRSHNTAVRIVAKYLLFAILWYWTAHQVESTVIPLELYFEHRNYIPSIGVYIFLSVALVVLYRHGQKKVAVLVGGSLILLFQVFNLQQLTSVWGQPAVAHELWYKNNPHSTRALQALATSYEGAGRTFEAEIIVENFIIDNNAADVAIQFFEEFCSRNSPEISRRRLDQIYLMASQMSAPAGLTTGLAKMGNSIRAGRCQSVEPGVYDQFLRKMLALPKVASNNRIRHHFEYEIAITALTQQDIDQYEIFAKKAFLDFPSYSVASSIALNIAQKGKIDDAISWIDEFPKYAANDLQSKSWISQIESMREALLEIKNHMSELDVKPRQEILESGKQ